MKTINQEVTDDIFTEDDAVIYRQAIRELEAGEAISLEKAKDELFAIPQPTAAGDSRFS